MIDHMVKRLTRLLTRLWAWTYRSWLEDPYCPGRYGTVVRVKGWRTALVDFPGGRRMTVTPCFWGLS